MTRTPRPDWPPAAISHLEQMHADGLTFDEIARRLKAMNYNFTRNACIGKAGRMRLPRRLTASDVAVLNARDNPKPKRIRKRMGIVKDTVAPPMQSPPLAPAKPSHRTGLHNDLEFGQCRWPLGEMFASPPFMFCTADAVPYRSYCTEHCQKAYQPVSRR